MQLSMSKPASSLISVANEIGLDADPCRRVISARGVAVRSDQEGCGRPMIFQLPLGSG